MRRRIFVAQPEVERELEHQAEVVLQIREVHLLPQVRDQDVAERVLRAEAEHEIREVVQVVRRRAGGP